jgi:hypothetical protein
MFNKPSYPTEILNYPLVDRINTLRGFIENANIKDLTTFYPQLGKKFIKFNFHKLIFVISC